MPDVPCCARCACCVQHTKELIQQTFGRVPRSDNQPSPAAGAWNAQLLAGAAGGSTAAAGAGAPSSSSSSSNGAPAATAAAEAEMEDAEAAEAAASTSGSGMASGAILDNLPKQKGMVGRRTAPGLLPCCWQRPLLRACDRMSPRAPQRPPTHRHIASLPLLACLPACLPACLQIRPPVEHQWGCSSQAVHGGPASGAPVSVFRHRLLQLFQLSIFCKLPVLPISTLEGLRRGFMVRILLSVLQFRVNGRYVEANPPFTGIGE